jgi:orotidine-5'-phosphate decarboxylase
MVARGIQLLEPGTTDQVRVATPTAAVRAGATHIIVGRAISAAENPVAAYQAIVAACKHEA